MTMVFQNLPLATPLDLARQLNFIPCKAQSRTIFQNETMAVTFFAIAAGERLSTSVPPGEVLAEVLQGKVKIIVDDKALEVNAGQIVILPGGIPHSMLALASFKMLHIVAFDRKPVLDKVDNSSGSNGI